jgi:uncharacterized protein (DUF433 family)
MIYIDPQRQFGRPSIAGIPTEELAGRIVAGETVEHVAADFKIGAHVVRLALAFEAGASYQRATRNGTRSTKRLDALLAALKEST